MKVNELRIGNYVMYEPTIDDWEERVITLHSLLQVDILPESYCGIPLTEEWLIKFGLKSNLDYEWYLESSYDWITLENIDKYFFQVKFGSLPLKKLKHVHQLQNLYFALTGEELTFKQIEDERNRK